MGPICKGECCGRGLDWVIVGGESGPGARPCDLAWIRSIVQQCRTAGVPCFVKQLGANPVEDLEKVEVTEHARFGPEVIRYSEPCDLRLHDRKGGDPAEWPEDLRVRETPGGSCRESGSIATARASTGATAARIVAAVWTRKKTNRAAYAVAVDGSRSVPGRDRRQ